MTMGSYIRERRLQLNMTQEDLGDAAGTSKAYISQIELGKVALPSADLRRRLGHRRRSSLNGWGMPAPHSR